MNGVQELLDHLTAHLNGHNALTYNRLAEGAQPEELAPMWAYSAGLQHAVECVQEGIRQGAF